MKKLVIAMAALIGAGLLLVLVAVSWYGDRYNGLVARDQGVKKSWAQIENALQRQDEVVPNLVELLKGEASFEKETLLGVTQARASLGQIKLTADMLKDPAAMANFNQAQSGLAGALSKLMVVTERYPDLKANAGFRDVRAEVEGSVNRVAVARTRYNEAAADFNTFRNGFLTQFVANRYGTRFEDKPMFAASEEAHKPLRVKM